MARRPSLRPGLRYRLRRVAAYDLMAVAYAACEVAAYPDGVPRKFGVGCGLAVLALAVVLNRVVPGPIPDQRLSGWWQAA